VKGALWTKFLFLLQFLINAPTFSPIKSFLSDSVTAYFYHVLKDLPIRKNIFILVKAQKDVCNMTVV
jgi:hypothetical protein